MKLFWIRSFSHNKNCSHIKRQPAAIGSGRTGDSIVKWIVQCSFATIKHHSVASNYYRLCYNYTYVRFAEWSFCKQKRIWYVTTRHGTLNRLTIHLIFISQTKFSFEPNKQLVSEYYSFQFSSQQKQKCFTRFLQPAAFDWWLAWNRKLFQNWKLDTRDDAAMPVGRFSLFSVSFLFSFIFSFMHVERKNVERRLPRESWKLSSVTASRFMKKRAEQFTR